MKGFKAHEQMMLPWTRWRASGTYTWGGHQPHHHASTSCGGGATTSRPAPAQGLAETSCLVQVPAQAQEAGCLQAQAQAPARGRASDGDATTCCLALAQALVA